MNHYAPMLAALVALGLVFILTLSKLSKAIQDTPNQRSLHSKPIPRIGGIGLIAGVLTGWATFAAMLKWWIVIPLLLLFMVSLIDDIKGLTAYKRLAIQVAAALLLVTGGGLVVQHLGLALFVLFLVVWMTNLYNFMDGSDGLAGGMAFFGFSVYGVAALMHGDEMQAMMNFSIGAAALGFLYHNFYPAKVFMGDAGSVPLGFLVGAMGMLGWQSEMWPWWFPALVFSPFIVDASITLFKRALRRAKLTEAHREHYYQRAIQMGRSHRAVALFEYALMLGAGVSALIAKEKAPEFVMLIFMGWSIVYGLIMITLDWQWSKFQRSSNC